MLVKRLQKEVEEQRFNRTSAVIADAENTLLKSKIKEMEDIITQLRSPQGHPIFVFLALKQRVPCLSFHRSAQPRNLFFDSKSVQKSRIELRLKLESNSVFPH